MNYYMRRAAVLGFLSFVLAGAQLFAFTEPSLPPPAGNVPAPVTTGGVGQIKPGDLTISKPDNTALLTTDKLVTIGGAILNTGGALNGLIVDKGNICFGADCRSSWSEIGFTNIQVFSSPGTVSWTVPPGVKKIFVEVYGGGGGGGSGGNAAGAGGAGGVAFKILPTEPGRSGFVTVGGGGGPGSPGGTSTFNDGAGTLIHATGGSPGSGGGSYSGAGGQGGLGSGGDINLQGGPGSPGGYAGNGWSAGGSNGRGGGGMRNAGGPFGGGGGGGANTSGWPGGNGGVIIWF